MSEAATVDGQGVNGGEVASGRSGEVKPLILPEGMVPVDMQAPVKQARSLRPRYQIAVNSTALVDGELRPLAHWLEGRYFTPEAADIDASSIYEQDYRAMRHAVGHIAVVRIDPGGEANLVSVRHFPEE